MVRKWMLVVPVLMAFMAASMPSASAMGIAKITGPATVTVTITKAHKKIHKRRHKHRRHRHHHHVHVKTTLHAPSL